MKILPFSFNLNYYTSDVDNDLSEINFSYSGNSQIGVVIDSSSHQVNLSAPMGWSGGPETITFTAIDSDFEEASESVDITVYPLYAPHLLTTENFLAIPEGEIGELQIKLTAAPSEDINVSIEHYMGDEDIILQSASHITFTTLNWDTYQTISFQAIEDVDTSQGLATIKISALGIPYKLITIIEEENDPVLYVSPIGGLDYGIVGVHESSQIQEFIVKNDGGGLLTVNVSSELPFIIAEGTETFELEANPKPHSWNPV